MANCEAIGKAISEVVAESSKGKCFQQVRKNIQKGLGEKDAPSGVKSAKDAEPWLLKRGFQIVHVEGGQYLNGDVVIIKEAPNHQHGHIQGYYNGHWYSDFKQNTPNPWINCQIQAVYRYASPNEKNYEKEQKQKLFVENCRNSSSPFSLHSATVIPQIPLKSYQPSINNAVVRAPSISMGGSSSSNSGFGLSQDRSNVGYTFQSGSRVSGGYSSGPKIEISIPLPCEIM